MCIVLGRSKSTLMHVLPIGLYTKVPQLSMNSSRILKVGVLMLELVKYFPHSNWPLADGSYSAFDLLITFCCQCKYFSFFAVQEMYIFI